MELQARVPYRLSSEVVNRLRMLINIKPRVENQRMLRAMQYIHMLSRPVLALALNKKLCPVRQSLRLDSSVDRLQTWSYHLNDTTADPRLILEDVIAVNIAKACGYQFEGADFPEIAILNMAAFCVICSRYWNGANEVG